MKQKLYCLISSCAMLFLVLCAINYSHYAFEAKVPVPNVPSGFYSAPIDLTFTVPKGCTVYYTTDGSAPSLHSLVYSGGIHIDNRSSQPNVGKSVQNVIRDWKNYTPSTSPVEKGTVIRAMSVNTAGKQSDVLTQTYFVNVQPPALGFTLSLVAQPDDLFGDSGIYVTGSEYDRWYLANDTTVPAPIPNFEKKVEVPAVIEILDANGAILNQSIGLRLQGATSRGEISKRFTLTAQSSYSGTNTFDVPLYGQMATHSVMVKDYFPDAIVADLVSDRDVATQQSIPVRVYLNGEFWYTSYLLERYDNQYFRQHYQVNNRWLVKNGSMDPDTVDLSQSDPYGEFMFWAANTDFSDPEEWAQLQKEMDIQSYIDFISINYYMANVDFGDYHNYTVWRSPYSGSSKWADNRWRWCIYDIDTLAWIWHDPSFGDPVKANLFRSDNPFDLHRTTLFPALRNNSDFCRQFVLSFMDIGNNNFRVEKVSQVLSSKGCDLRWIDLFFRDRPKYAAAQLAEEFRLTGTLETVHITTLSPQMGNVQVNTSIIDLTTGSWSGQYFTDYPITLTAFPRDGYVFVGWRGSTNSSESQITVSAADCSSLEAVFAPV